MRRALGALGAVLSAVSVANGSPRELVGRWSEESSWCEKPSGDQRPDKIDQRGIEHFASACRLSDWRQRSRRSWSASARCREEGEEGLHRRRYTFRLKSNDRLEYSIDGDLPTARLRCIRP